MARSDPKMGATPNVRPLPSLSLCTPQSHSRAVGQTANSSTHKARSHRCALRLPANPGRGTPMRCDGERQIRTTAYPEVDLGHGFSRFFVLGRFKKADEDMRLSGFAPTWKVG